jgi:hypothetical protein
LDLSDRRKDKRLTLAYSVVCRSVEREDVKPRRGYVRNASAGGLYFGMITRCFRLGEVVRIDLLVPATSGVLERGGKVSCYAKVLRTEIIAAPQRQSRSSAASYGVAVQFCDYPKLSVCG